MDQLCDRAEAVEKRKVRAEVDNMLKITGDGSKSSTGIARCFRMVRQ
jgi:hypothetical protein